MSGHLLIYTSFMLVVGGASFHFRLIIWHKLAQTGIYLCDIVYLFNLNATNLKVYLFAMNAFLCYLFVLIVSLTLSDGKPQLSNQEAIIGKVIAIWFIMNDP